MPAPREKTAEAADSTTYFFAIIETVMMEIIIEEQINSMDGKLQMMKQLRRFEMAGVQMKEASIWQRYDPFTGEFEIPRRPELTRCNQGRLKSSRAYAIMRRSGILYQLLGLVLVTMRRGQFSVVSPFGEGLCTRQIRMSSSYTQHQLSYSIGKFGGLERQ